MPTIDTVVIGAGHAGLAVSRLLTDAGRDHVVLDRGRVAERWRTAALGLPAPAHAELDDPAARLVATTGPDPDGFMSAGEFVDAPRALRRRPSAPRSSAARRCRRSAPGRRRRPVPRRHRPRRPGARATSSSRPARTATPARPRRASARTPGAHRQPTTATRDQLRRRRRARRRRVGVRRPDRRRAQPVRAARSSLAVGRHTRMPRRYRGMDIFWWLERTGRSPAPSTRCPTRWRPDASRRCSWSVARTPPASPRPRPGALQARGVRLVGRLDGHGRTAARFADDLAEHVAAADATMHRFLDAVDGYVDECRLDRRGVAGGPAAPVDAAARRPAPRPARRGHRHRRWSPPATARPPVAAAARSPRRTARSASTAASPRRPASYVVGQRFQHRRDSGFIDGARHDARGRRPAPARRAQRPSRRSDSARSQRHEHGYDVVVVGGRVAGASTAMLLARAGARVALRRPRRPYGTDTLSTHGLMRAGVLQLSRWGLLDRVVAAGTPPIRRTVFHYADGEPVQVSIRPSAGVDALTRRAAPSSTGSSSTRPRRRAPTSGTRRR